MWWCLRWGKKEERKGIANEWNLIWEVREQSQRRRGIEKGLVLLHRRRKNLIIVLARLNFLFTVNFPHDRQHNGTRERLGCIYVLQSHDVHECLSARCRVDIVNQTSPSLGSWWACCTFSASSPWLRWSWDVRLRFDDTEKCFREKKLNCQLQSNAEANLCILIQY